VGVRVIQERPVESPPEALDGTAASPVARGLRAIAPRLRAVILLGGSVRESVLSRSLHRSTLDLPLDRGRTILGAWAEQAAALARAGGIGSLSLRVLINQTTAPPAVVPAVEGLNVTLEFDRAELRGTGGLLRDLADEYEPEDLLLVANAHQVVIPPLEELAGTLGAAMSDVALLATTQRTPCGLNLFRCKALRTIKTKGFIDLKEQALPAIASAFQVKVVASRPGVVFPVRTLEGYLGALRALHSPALVGASDPLAEDCFPTFSLVEEGASMAPSARAHDSVVLRGARVGADAVLVRSLLCEGAVVEAGEVVADRVVGSQARAVERTR
jgi:hypothetical protein